MTSKELVIKTMKGDNPGQTPLYGWVRENLSREISESFGSVENFEDHYRFDLAHIFGGPSLWGRELEDVRSSGVEITPEVLLQIPMKSPDDMSDYDGVVKALRHHHDRERFCYMQTNGIFEAANGAFGIENHLLYMALYPDELMQVYGRIADLNIRAAGHFIELGVDGIHVSDDWGAQNSLLFSRSMFEEMIFPHHRRMVSAYKKHGVLVSLHSDGCITPVLDLIPKLGYDFIHPWQENADMPYSLYLDNYRDKFGILGGVCVQSALGFGDPGRLEAEIRRVFSLLKGKRWACCTTHFVQSHCSMEELIFAFDLMRRLADADN